VRSKGVPKSQKWHSVEDGKGQGVIDPVSGEEVTDATLAQAIREGKHYITKRYSPRTVVDWQKFMYPRRTYRQVPKYTGISDDEVQIFQKFKHEAMVPVAMIGAVWGKHGLKAVMEFIVSKQIPVYRWPNSKKGRSGYYVFCGDIVRAIKSCEIDLRADGDAWIKYMMMQDRRKRLHRERVNDEKVAARIAAGDAYTPETGGNCSDTPAFDDSRTTDRDDERDEGTGVDG
jgi:hypothetical protein